MEQKNSMELTTFLTDAQTKMSGVTMLLLSKNGVAMWPSNLKSVRNIRLPDFKDSEMTGWKLFDNRELATRFLSALVPDPNDLLELVAVQEDSDADEVTR